MVAFLILGSCFILLIYEFVSGFCQLRRNIFNDLPVLFQVPINTPVFFSQLLQILQCLAGQPFQHPKMYCEMWDCTVWVFLETPLEQSECFPESKISNT
jgi:hypothetical protein